MSDHVREQALLLACAGSRPSPCSLAKIQSLADLLDWDYVAAAAETHLVWPLVLANLQRAGVRLPGALVARWQELSASTTGDNLALMSQLARLFDLFDAHGVPAVTWKGPVLAAIGYGSLSLRSSGDLDVLVPFHRIRDVRALLLANGYTQPAINVWFAPAARREYQFVPREAGRCALEAHVFVARWPLAVRLPTDELIARGIPVTVAGRCARTLCHEDMLLAMALHGACHAWTRLRFVADVDACARAAVDWHVVVGRARSARMQRILSTALLLAHDLLGTPVPPAIVEDSRRDRTAVWLRTYLGRQLNNSAKPRNRDWIGFLSREHAIDQVRYALRQFFLLQIMSPGDRVAAFWQHRRFQRRWL